MLSNREKEELLQIADSRALRNDMRYLKTHRHNPVLVNGIVDLDKLIEFLNGYNAFINHQPKPFRPLPDSIMKL